MTAKKETRTKQINIRITEAEYERFAELADKKEMTLSALVRDQLNKMAKR
jgi:predicted HicB family RNase H-like nuclease